MLVLSGCYSQIALQDAERFSDADVCGQYGGRVEQFAVTGYPKPQTSFATGKPFDALVAEIKSRRLVRPEQVDAVLRRQVAIGMTDIEALCTWGAPTTVTAVGAEEQWVYIPKYGPRPPNDRSLTIASGYVTAINH